MIRPHRAARTASVRAVVVFGLATLLLVLIAAGLFYRYAAHRRWPLLVARTTPSLSHLLDIQWTEVWADEYGYELGGIFHDRLSADFSPAVIQKSLLERMATARDEDELAWWFGWCPMQTWTSGPLAEQYWPFLVAALLSMDRHPLDDHLLEVANVIERPASDLLRMWIHRSSSPSHYPASRKQEDALEMALRTAFLATHDHEAIQVLGAALLDVEHPLPTVLSVLEQILRAWPMEVVGERLESWIPRWSPQVAAAVIELLASTPGSFAWCLRQCELRPEFRLAVCTGWAQQRGLVNSSDFRRAWPSIAKLMKVEDQPEIIVMYLILLGNLGDVAYADVVRPYLTDKHEKTRIEALRTWYIFHAEAAWTELIAALDDPLCRSEALRLLSLINPEALTPVQRDTIERLDWSP